MKVVYIAWNESTQQTKVGVTSNIADRVKGLSTDKKSKVILITKTYPLHNYLYIENLIINKFKNVACHGKEWLCIHYLDVANYLRTLLVKGKPHQLVVAYLLHGESSINYSDVERMHDMKVTSDQILDLRTYLAKTNTK